MNGFFTARPLGVFGLAMALLIFGMAAPVFGQNVPRIEPDKLEGMLGAPDLVVVDVRSNGQRQSSGRKIRTASLVQANRLKTWTGDLARQGMIVLYCDWPNEETSAGVARQMMNQGFERVYVLEGGWDAWEKGDYPMENFWASSPADDRTWIYRRPPTKGDVMARFGNGLDTKDPFPDIELNTYQGETIRLPEYFGEGFGVVLFLRGNWWPFCDQQLADFHAHFESMKAEDVRLVVGSVDPTDKIRETMEKLGIFRIPFAVDLDAREISRRYGVYFEEEKEYLHAAGFLLLPGGKILAAAYSSGPVGRLAARDVINLVRFVKSEQRKSFHLIGGLLEVR